MNVESLSEEIKFKNSKFYNICYEIKDYVFRYLESPCKDFKLFTMYKSTRFKNDEMMCCGKAKDGRPVFITSIHDLPLYYSNSLMLDFHKHGVIIFQRMDVFCHLHPEELEEVIDPEMPKYEY